MVWDPFGTIRRALWVGGSQCRPSSSASTRSSGSRGPLRSRSPGLSDPERAQRNRLARVRILAADAVDSARRHGMRVIEVDGSLGEEEVADLLAEHFAAHLH